jgi:hypothetical protein
MILLHLATVCGETLTGTALSSGLRTCDLQKKEETLNSDKIFHVLALLRSSYFSKNVNKDNRYENNRRKGSLGVCFTSVVSWNTGFAIQQSQQTPFLRLWPLYMLARVHEAVNENIGFLCHRRWKSHTPLMKQDKKGVPHKVAIEFATTLVTLTYTQSCLVLKIILWS